jgi:hypothetical protein
MIFTSAAAAGATATEARVQEVLDWFARYDALVDEGNLDAMADMAAFPINEVTDDADGHGLAGPCDREKFLTQMREVVGGAGEVQMTSERHPVFLSPALCFVVTDASMTVGEQTTQMRYGDLLVRTADGWRFQTMVAGGWHDHM